MRINSGVPPQRVYFSRGHVDNGGLVSDDGWEGDLRRFSMRAWHEESMVAAMVVTHGGDAAAWVNLKHVHLQESRLVWLWARYAAHNRPPVDVLYVEDLAALLAGGGEQQFGTFD